MAKTTGSYHFNQLIRVHKTKAGGTFTKMQRFRSDKPMACEACDRPGMRNGWVVKNETTGKELKVGIRCVGFLLGTEVLPPLDVLEAKRMEREQKVVSSEEKRKTTAKEKAEANRAERKAKREAKIAQAEKEKAEKKAAREEKQKVKEAEKKGKRNIPVEGQEKKKRGRPKKVTVSESVTIAPPAQEASIQKETPPVEAAPISSDPPAASPIEEKDVSAVKVPAKEDVIIVAKTPEPPKAPALPTGLFVSTTDKKS